MTATNVIAVLEGKLLSQQGLSYTFSDRDTGLSNDASTFFYMANPADSGHNIEIHLVARASGLSDVTITTNATVNSSGTTLTPRNILSGSTRSVHLTAETDGSYTAGTSYVEDIIPGSSTGIRVGSHISRIPSAIIEPGDNTLIELTNRSGGSEGFAITATIFEQPRYG